MAAGEKKRISLPLRFGFSTLLIFFTLAVLLVRFVIAPEYERTQTVDKLIAAGHQVNGDKDAVAFPPGVLPPTTPKTEPERSFRQSLAGIFGIKTIPWNENLTVKLIGATDSDVAMACKLKDLKELHLFESKIGDETGMLVANAKNLKVLKLESTEVTEKTLNTVVELPGRVLLHWIN